jgi:hypothetical protein
MYFRPTPSICIGKNNWYIAKACLSINDVMVGWGLWEQWEYSTADVLDPGPKWHVCRVGRFLTFFSF